MLEVEPRLEKTSEVALWVVARRGEGGDAVEIVACWMRRIMLFFLLFLSSVQVEGIDRPPEQVAREARTTAPRRCEAANNASGMVEKKNQKMVFREKYSGIKYKSKSAEGERTTMQGATDGE